MLITDGVSIELLPLSFAQIQYVDYRHEDRKAFRALSKALTSLPISPPLPNPLPKPPNAPVSYLVVLKEQLEMPRIMSFEEQTGLLARLRHALHDAKDAEHVATLTLLRLFRSREELFAKVADEIDVLLTVPRLPSGSEKATLEPEILEQRREIAESKPQLPGRGAPNFHLLEEKIALLATPCADPMTPMYMLDRSFRVIDWNDALTCVLTAPWKGGVA